ncbi:MAG: prepilin peptidase [Clostridium sp.]|nr:prepilin peptidase [Clostridium sp.]
MTEYVRMIMFGGFLLTAAAEDMRHRQVSRRLLITAAFCGIPWGLRGAFCGGAASFAAGFLPGAMLLLLSRLSRGAVGSGDGIFFLAAALYLPADELFGLFFGGMMLCGLYSAAVIVKRIFANRPTGSCRVAFLPFLVPVWLLQAVSGCR